MSARASYRPNENNARIPIHLQRHGGNRHFGTAGQEAASGAECQCIPGGNVEGEAGRLGRLIQELNTARA
jgi:hypothetical protein